MISWLTSRVERHYHDKGFKDAAAAILRGTDPADIRRKAERNPLVAYNIGVLTAVERFSILSMRAAVAGAHQDRIVQHNRRHS